MIQLDITPLLSQVNWMTMTSRKQITWLIKMEVMQSGTEERKMSIKGWRRLKRIPQGSVENGIIRR